MKNIDIDREYLTRLKKKRRPLVVVFELTEQCNLQCIHCCIRNEGGGGGHKELTTAQLRRILREMRDAGVIYIVSSGGEPLWRPDE